MIITQLEKCIAKTQKNEKTGQFEPGETVLEHCENVVDVFEILAKIYGIPAVPAEAVIAMHDIGKISSTFQDKIYELCENVEKLDYWKDREQKRDNLEKALWISYCLFFHGRRKIEAFKSFPHVHGGVSIEDSSLATRAMVFPTCVGMFLIQFD